MFLELEWRFSRKVWAPNSFQTHWSNLGRPDSSFICAQLQSDRHPIVISSGELHGLCFSRRGFCGTETAWSFAHNGKVPTNTALVAVGHDGNVFGMQSGVCISHGSPMRRLRWSHVPHLCSGHYQARVLLPRML
jgi:hypothetical protein